MISENLSTKSFLSTLRDLKVGESYTYPSSKANYMKSACSNFGFQWGRKFKTCNNRKESTFTVTRIE